MLAIRQHDFAKVIELRCQVVKEWLHRSGTCPLSISLHYPTSHNPALDDTNLPRRGADLGSNPLLLLVLSFSRRWKQVDLVLPPSVYDELEAHLSGDLLPILETFRLADCRGPRLRPMTGAGSLRPFMESPNLRRLCIDAMLLTRDIAMLPPTVWNRLTCLCIIQSISDVAFYDLIRHCHSLIHCEAQLKASQAYERRLSHRQTDIVSLIKVFKLDDLSSPVGILQSIYFPSLEFLDYRYTSSPFAVDFPPPFFLTIIKHAPTTFWKLNFAPRKLSSIHSIRGLHLASGITHLSLDCTPYLRVHTEDDMLMPEDCLDFSVFAINTTGGCKDILVPKLEVLEMYNVQRLTDETILRVLLSRIDAAQMGVVSPLRHVKIDIWRRRQKDIHEAVLEHAKSAGFEMKLELNYLPYRRVYHDRFSPSFLLASDNW
ncbi:hypothetical protein M413DRAFT_7746 [Hebeloma cylindrosporum]|uniref:F-box domain-containing protein n=1 Tax=Hebeloma cylindrosporum TaxID=76867 RepID=A0A0C3CSW5_HEBCY|nr:hypothetical protein M413DRAFT_7746 [Hebeloma cylindrosporum h7]